VASQLPALTRAARVALLHGPYVIVNEGARDPVAIARACLRAGIRVLQYRAKRGIAGERLRAIRDATTAGDALLIVNDDVEAAIAFDCDGVHLGPDDGAFDPLGPVRDRMGERLIGISAGTPDEARAAERAHADYVGIGAVYATASKDDAGAPIGIHGLLDVAAASTLSAAAIGGITAGTIAEIARTGVAMAAVISAVADASDPEAAARELVAVWNRERRT
jgi:thiamine-phosphate diphosphorylase